MSVNSPAKFWLVWCPTGTHSPVVKHMSMHAAMTESKRLAAQHIGREFFVVESIGLAVIRVDWAETNEMEIPF
jgi:hypothetical protein